MSRALLLFVLLHPAPLRAQADAPRPDPERPEAIAALRARLVGLDEALARRPDATALRWERVRTLYALAVADEAALATATALVDSLAATSPTDLEGVRARAYAGALEVLRGKHAFWPHDKLRHVRQGLTVLDTAVAAHPDDVEIRNLRMLSTYYLPFFFGRGDSAREDLGALARLLPHQPAAMSPGSLLGVVRFVMEHGDEVDPATLGELRALEALLERLRGTTEFAR